MSSLNSRNCDPHFLPVGGGNASVHSWHSDKEEEKKKKRDASCITEQTSRISSDRRLWFYEMKHNSNVPAFLTKLWTLVEDADTNEFICWSQVRLKCVLLACSYMANAESLHSIYRHVVQITINYSFHSACTPLDLHGHRELSSSVVFLHWAPAS